MMDCRFSVLFIYNNQFKQKVPHKDEYEISQVLHKEIGWFHY